jgi:integrase
VTPGTKYDLEDATKFNRFINLNKTPDGGVDRGWEESEYNKFIGVTRDKGKDVYADIFVAIRETGMRLDEVVSLKRSEIRESLNKNKLILQITKGNVPRSVPLTDKARNILEKRYSESKGIYAFTPSDKKTRLETYEKNIQTFIIRNRSGIQNNDRHRSAHNVPVGKKGALTAHGLRHSFARERYKEMRSKGYNPKKARYKTAKLLGHSRDEITKVYLGGS